jgi:hypothetical protein
MGPIDIDALALQCTSRKQARSLRVSGGGGHSLEQNIQHITVEVVNLTPHAVHTVDEDGNVLETYPASGTVARCEKKQVQVETLNGVPVFQVKMGEVYDLPPKQEGIAYIVSRLTAAGAPERDDLYCPNDLVRDDEGRIIGLTSFSKD